MSFVSTEILLGERIAKLDKITERRNALLREMHQLIRNKTESGFLISSEDEHDEESVFLERFRITKDNPDQGSIINLVENETFHVHPDGDIGVLKAAGSSQNTFSRKVTQGSQPRGLEELSRTPSPDEKMVYTPVGTPRPSPRSLVVDTRASDSEEDELDCLRKSPPAKEHTKLLAPSLPNEYPSFKYSATSSIPVSKFQNLALKTETETPSVLSDLREAKGEQVDENESSLQSDFGEPASPMDVGLPSGGTIRMATKDRHAENPAMTSVEDSSANNISHVYGPASPPYRLYATPVVAPMKKPLVIRTAYISGISEPRYSFPELPPPETKPSMPLSHPQRELQYRPDFTLPPVKAISSAYNKKAKLPRRKRDREREASTGRKDEWLPLGLNKWTATVNANPVWKKVARASKCLTTREWAIAMSELRLIRAIERVETLKREGRWSLRQPKKQRAMGNIQKTHWDYLMDEMKWMRIDFREERRWKLALAYNLSTAVLEWHAAGTLEARIVKGVCVHWKRPRTEQPDNEMAIDDTPNTELSTDEAAMEVEDSQVEQLQPSSSLLGVDYGSEDDDDGENESEERYQSVVNLLEPSDAIRDAFHNVDKVDETDGIRIDRRDIQPKTEETEYMAALADFKSDMAVEEANIAIPGFEETKLGTVLGLRTTSNDPLLGSQPTPSSNGGDTERPSSAASKLGAKLNIYASLRETIAYSGDDKLFLDLEQFTMAELGENTSLPPPKLESIFPDLQILCMPDPATALQPISEGKKRAEKRAERDDPSRRLDDTLYTKLYPTGNFMTARPTLIGPLRPSKNWKDGQWLSADDIVTTPDFDSGGKDSDEVISELFDNRASNTQSVIMTLQAASIKDKDNKQRSDHLWSGDDDALLKSFADKYSFNWALISECLNASRLTIPTDKRSPRDCFDRWRERWGSETRRPTEGFSAAEVTPAAGSNQMTTRGVKRLASSGISNSTITATGGEPKKRRRHLLVQEIIRKAGKKRAEALLKIQAAQRKAPAIHETHAQYSKLPKRTPAELSRVKADKESRELAEIQAARKRQEEMNRQVMSRMMGSGQVSSALQQQSQQPQVGGPMQRPVGTGIPAPSQVVPQIRSQVNISQQQRTSTPSMPPGGRLSQQMLQAQARAVQQQQVQAHAQVLAQAQSHLNNAVTVNGSVVTNNPHLSPPYVARDITSSPAHVSPPTAPATVVSPRPPSAQAHPLLQAAQVPGTAGSRGGYYLPNLPSVQGYTTEQIHTLHTALRHQQQQQQQSQQGLSGFPGQS